LREGGIARYKEREIYINASFTTGRDSAEKRNAVLRMA